MIDVGCTALTVRQPWATLIGLGLKQAHPMRWPTNHRGTLAIHADRISSEPGLEQVVAGLDVEGMMVTRFQVEAAVYPLGAVVALVDLVACEQITSETVEKERLVERCLGVWSPGRYAWRFENPRMLEFPYPARGQEGLWQLEVPV